MPGNCCAGFRDLIRSTNRNRSNCLLLLHQPNNLGKTLHAALKNHVGEAAQNVPDTIAPIEDYSARLRRLQAETLFP